MTAKSPSGTPKTFEESLKRLQEIVEILERGEVSLEKSLDLYEEGVRLSNFCLEKLTKAELRIKELSQTLDKTFRIRDVDFGEFTHSGEEE